jgi:hypothetical protein
MVFHIFQAVCTTSAPGGPFPKPPVFPNNIRNPDGVYRVVRGIYPIIEFGPVQDW